MEPYKKNIELKKITHEMWKKQNTIMVKLWFVQKKKIIVRLIWNLLEIFFFSWINVEVSWQVRRNKKDLKNKIKKKIEESKMFKKNARV